MAFICCAFFGLRQLHKEGYSVTIFEAAQSASLPELQHMVEYECQNFMERDAQGNTLLHYAARSGSVEKTAYLTEYLALDPLEANLSGVTPLDAALHSGCTAVAAYLEKRAGVLADDCFHNPVRRGFYPDPSWLRMGDDYYMVNSSFSFFPCLPIAKSRDLVHWTTVGYAITNPEWAQIAESEGGRGYWAPDISYDEATKRYYITATLRGNEGGAEPRCQMVVSAEKPEGPYGEPAWIHEDGIDPSLFHDDDGRHYMLFNREVRMVELTADCRAAKGPAKLIWGGSWKIKTEGPQLMKRDGYYYLLAAEGGTGSGHRISAARSKNIWGPYESCPYNPILRQDDAGGYLQNCGHGKLLETADGRWYLCHLCLRRRPNGTAPMGRETAIVEVTWTPDGWPIAKTRRPQTVLAMPLPAHCEEAAPAALLDWKRQEWLTQRAPENAGAAVAGKTLQLTGNGRDLCDMHQQGLLLVRQQETDFTVEAELCTGPLLAAQSGTTAGLTCYYDEHSYLKFGVGPGGLLLEEYAGYEVISSKIAPLPTAEKIRLRITAGQGTRSFAVENGGAWQTLWTIPEPPYLTSEGLKCGKRFTGAMVGLYVHGDCTVSFTDWAAVWPRPEEEA